jgi:cytochrome c biogenesis protein CcdA
MAGRDERGARRATPENVATPFKDEADASSSLFDLRYLIGGLFTVYGVILIVANFFVSNTKAGGIMINLWLGLAMLILGLLFLAWARLRPLRIGGESALARAEHADERPNRRDRRERSH